MRLLVCGGAGFIGSNFARQRLREHGDEVIVLDKLTYAGRRGEPPRPRRGPPRFRFVRGAIEDPRGGRGGDRGGAPRRSSTSPPRRTSTARSPSPTRSSPRTRSAPTCCSRRRASAGCATCRSPPTRSTARSRRARSPRARRSRPSSPYSATKAGADLLVQSYFHTYGLPALICRGSNNYGPYQYPEKLIPLMVLNALHGDALPVYGDGHAGAQLDPRRRTSPPRSATCSSTAAPARSTTSAAPTSSANIEVVTRIVALHRRDRVADRARRRPARPRPPLLARPPRRSARSAGRRACASTRASSDRRLVPRERLVVGADPLGRLPRLLRAPVRALAAALSHSSTFGVADLQRRLHRLSGTPARIGTVATRPASRSGRRAPTRSARSARSDPPVGTPPRAARAS